MYDYTEVQSLDEFLDGGINERFQQEMKKVISNILDETTKPDKTRNIVITISITPDQKRQHGKVKVSTSTKFAPPVEAEKNVVFGANEDGEISMFEELDQLIGQIDMNGKEQEGAKIYSLEESN